MNTQPRLSVLDLVPVRSGQTSAQALAASLELAVLADRLGFERYWFAEHHNMAAVAASSPPVMIAAASFGMISYLTGNAVFSDYLQIRYVAGTGELAVLCGAVLGAGLGFLWFNAPPASIFMGDTGSLALGGMLGSIAVAVKHEIVLAVIGGLFVLEAVSVVVQVFFFKRYGRRVFKMAPIHHHFEHLGWSEPTVVIRFWIISFILALAGLSTLKLR